MEMCKFEMNYLASKMFIRSLHIFGRFSDKVAFHPYTESSPISGRPGRTGLKASFMDSAHVCLIDLDFAPRFFESSHECDAQYTGGPRSLSVSTKGIQKLFRCIPNIKLAAFQMVLGVQTMHLVARYAGGLYVERIIAGIDMPTTFSRTVDTGLNLPRVFSFSASYLSSLLSLLPESSHDWLVKLYRDNTGLLWMSNDSSLSSHDSVSVVELPLESAELSKNNSLVYSGIEPVVLHFPLSETRSLCGLCSEESMGSERRIEGLFTKHPALSPDESILRVSTVFDQLGFRADVWYSGCKPPVNYIAGADILSVDEIDNDPLADHNLVEAFIIDESLP